MEKHRLHPGWHNFANELMLFRAQIKQFLLEPDKNIEKMKAEAVSMKRFIEAVVECPEDEGNQE
jgi:hypothetical protein